MADIIVDNNKKTFTIGWTGEKNINVVKFDISSLVETYGEADGVQLLVQNESNSVPYLASKIKRIGKVLRWDLSPVDLGTQGYLTVQINYFINSENKLAKSEKYRFYVKQALGDNPVDAPEYKPEWYEEIQNNAMDAVQAAKGAEHSAANAKSDAERSKTSADRAEQAANNINEDGRLAKEYSKIAKNSAIEAKKSENYVKVNADRAEKYGRIAYESAREAGGLAASAKNSEEIASREARKAVAANTHLSEVEKTVISQANIAKVSSDLAVANAKKAADSEVNADRAAVNAANSSKSAKGHSDSAYGYAREAMGYRDQTEQFKMEAATHAANAKTSETNAKGSETQSSENATISKQALADLLKMLGTDIATLENGKIPASQIPSIATTEIFTAGSKEAQDALFAQNGDICIRTDEKKSYIWKDDGWVYLMAPTDNALFATHAETSDFATNASQINGHRIVQIEKSQWDTAVKDPATYYLVYDKNAEV